MTNELENKKNNSETKKAEPLKAEDLFDEEVQEEGKLETANQDTRVRDLKPEGWSNTMIKGGRTTLLLIKRVSEKVELLIWIMALMAAIFMGGKAFTGQYGDMLVFIFFTLVSANTGFKLPNSKGLQVAKDGKKRLVEVYERTITPKD